MTPRANVAWPNLVPGQIVSVQASKDPKTPEWVTGKVVSVYYSAKQRDLDSESHAAIKIVFPVLGELTFGVNTMHQIMVPDDRQRPCVPMKGKRKDDPLKTLFYLGAGAFAGLLAFLFLAALW